MGSELEKVPIEVHVQSTIERAGFTNSMSSIKFKGFRYMLVVIITFILIVLWDIRGLLKDKDRVKTMIIYFIFIGASLTVSILLSIGKRPVSPAKIIELFLQL